MAKLRPLTIELRGVDRLSGPLRKARQRLDRFAKSTQRLRTAVAPIGRAFVLLGVAAAGAAAAGIAKFVKSGDDLVKVADRVGLTTERLQELRFAAKRASVEQSTLSSSLTALAKRVGELKSGGGALLGFLKRTNPALARQLALTKDTGEAFDLLVAALDDLPTASDRAALAAAAFSRSGIALVTMSEGGIAGLNQLAKEARELGLVLDRETLEASVAVADQWTNLTTVLRGIGAIVGSAALPVIRDLVTGIVAWTRANRDLIRTKAGDFARGMAQGLRLAVDAMRSTFDVVGKVVAAVGGLDVVFAAIAAGSLPIILASIAGALAAILSPIGLVVAGVALLGGLAAVVVKNWEPIKGFFTDLWAGIVETFTVAVGGIRRRITSVLDGITSAIRAAIDFLPESVTSSLGIETQPVGTVPGAPAAAAAIAAAGGEARVGGKIEISVNSKGQAQVDRIESDASDVELEVQTGALLGAT